MADDLPTVLESAPKGSRELDLRIALSEPSFDPKRWIKAPGGGYEQRLREVYEREGFAGIGDTGCDAWRIPYHSTSLDAALTLVPEGWTQGHLHWPGYDDGVLINNARADLHHALSSGGDPKVRGFGASRALALCAAALRARKTAND